MNQRPLGVGVCRTGLLDERGGTDDNGTGPTETPGPESPLFPLRKSLSTYPSSPPPVGRQHPGEFGTTPETATEVVAGPSLRTRVYGRRP